MKIKVTKNHIAFGVPESSCRCPVALAMIAALPHFSDDISVAPCGAHLGGTYQEFPEIVAMFIEAFDNGEDVEPFSFEFP